MLGDMPGVTAADLDRLIAAFAKSGGTAIVRATHGGKRGNPVILPRALFPEIAKLEGDTGARHIVESREQSGHRRRDRRRRQRRRRHAGGDAARRRRAAGLRAVLSSPCGKVAERASSDEGIGGRAAGRDRSATVCDGLASDSVLPAPSSSRRSAPSHLPPQGRRQGLPRRTPRVKFFRSNLLAAVLMMLAPFAAHATSLEPFKDDLFAYPATLSSEDGGAYLVVDYREARDINERDEVPERRVKRAYVSLGVRRQQQDLKLTTADRRSQPLRRRQDRRRVDHHDLPARARRQPQARRRRLHLRRQFQPHQESDGRQWRALSVARFLRFRRPGRGRGRSADRALCERLA